MVEKNLEAIEVNAAEQTKKEKTPKKTKMKLKLSGYDEIKALLPHGRFKSEDDVRSIIMNGFIKKGVDVWDCPAEFNLVNEPIMIDHIPFGILVGDFPFRWKNAYYIVELKFIKLICEKVSETAYKENGSRSPGKFHFRRISKQILDGQSKMLREGGGFLIVVAEPSLETAKLKQLFTDTLDECQGKLLTKYQKKLVENESPYEVWVLNQESFLRLWDEVLVGETAKPVGEDRWGQTDIRRTLSLQGLETVVEADRTLLTLNEIVEGKITDIVIEKIKERNKVRRQCNVSGKHMMVCEMNTPYFVKEEDVRYVLLNSFFRADIDVWDCDPAGRQCADPLVMGFAPLVPMTGDFPIFWRGQYHIIEVKWSKLRCNLAKDRKHYLYKKGTRQISRSITETILNGGGFLIYVVEPLPKDLNYQMPLLPTKLQCERQIDSTFRIELGRSRLPYEVWILDQRRFERVFRGKFGSKRWEIRGECESGKDRKVLGFRELEETVPEARVYLTMQEIKEGKIISLIDQLASKKAD